MLSRARLFSGSLCFAALFFGAFCFGQEAPQKTEPSGTPQAKRPVKVRISEPVANAFIVKKVPPVYPSDARKKHIQGQVALKVSISTEGDVQDVVVMSGEAALAPAAVEAVRQWKFKPYLLNGEPAEVETQIHLNFVLSPK